MTPHEPGLRLDLQLQRPGFALRVAVQLPAQGITAVAGPSGSGKTTLLRCVAGLERASGTVTMDGMVWQHSSRNACTPTWQREIGYVFQEASLFEHLDVRRNVAFGQRRVKATRDAAHALEASIELLGIAHLLPRSVQSLSGGERQRVAIARALATNPKLLLLDEPLAALDPARRNEILPWLERLRDERRLPMLYVTHSPQELARLADRVLLLNQGKVAACADASDVFARPELAASAGDDAGALLVGAVAMLDTHWHMAQVDTPCGPLWVRDDGLAPGQTVRLRVLARDVSLSVSAQPDSSIQNRLSGRIESIHPDTHQAQALVRVHCQHAALLARVTYKALHQLQLGTGSPVWCQVKSVALAR